MNIGPNLSGFEELLRRTVRVIETLPDELHRIADALELHNTLLDESIQFARKRP